MAGASNARLNQLHKQQKCLPSSAVSTVAKTSESPEQAIDKSYSHSHPLSHPPDEVTNAPSMLQHTHHSHKGYTMNGSETTIIVLGQLFYLSLESSKLRILVIKGLPVRLPSTSLYPGADPGGVQGVATPCFIKQGCQEADRRH